MDAAVTTGIFTLGRTALGGVIVNVNQRAADRGATRGQAGDLLATVTTAAIAVETELAMYRERRISARANGRAAGQAALEMLATRAEGNWLRGAATGVRELRAWDQAETARLYERFATAAAEMSPALVNLLLMSPELQR